MTLRKSHLLIIALLVISGISGFLFYVNFISGGKLEVSLNGDEVKVRPQFEEYFEDAERFLKNKKPFPYLVALDGSGNILGVIVETHDLVPDEVGYNGPIKMVLAVNLKGKISGLDVLEHNEDMAYVEGFTEDWYLNRYIGKTADDDITIESGGDIDSITQATLTCSTVARIVYRSLDKITSEILKAGIAQPDPEKPDLEVPVLNVEQRNKAVRTARLKRIQEELKKGNLRMKEAKYYEVLRE